MEHACVAAGLFPHPPIMLPEIGGDELQKIASTVRAVQEAARLIVSQKPETLVKAIRDAQSAANYMDYKAGLITEKEYEKAAGSTMEVKQKEKVWER